MAFDKIVAADSSTYQLPTVVRTRISSNISSGTEQEYTAVAGVVNAILAAANLGALPQWTTATRPTPGEQALIGFNTDLEAVEVYNTVADEWQEIGGGSKFTVGTTAPVGAENGDTWFNSETGSTYIYYSDVNSSQWVEIGSGGGSGGDILVADTAPVSPQPGDLWYDSVSGSTFIYYQDTDSTQWVEIGQTGAPTAAFVRETPPASAERGQLWFDTTDGTLYVYYVDGDSSQWIGVKAATSPINNFSELEDVSTPTPVSGDSLVYNGTNWVNGPRSGNAIINGDFGIWQRGTSFSTDGYTADRWLLLTGGSGTYGVSQQTLSPGDFQSIGYGEGEFFLRMSITTASSLTFASLRNRIENVRTLAGQKITLSFWAKSDSTRTFQARMDQFFGSGGSALVTSNFPSVTTTTSWQRFSVSIDLPSVSGKTIGSGSFLQLVFNAQVANGSVTDIWGVQLEAGPVATPFRLAGGGSKGAELALCQRYYYEITAPGPGAPLMSGGYYTSTVFYGVVFFPVEMRVTPGVSSTNNAWTVFTNNAARASTVFSLNNASKTAATLALTTSAGTAGHGGWAEANVTVQAPVKFSAEL